MKLILDRNTKRHSILAWMLSGGLSHSSALFSRNKNTKSGAKMQAVESRPGVAVPMETQRKLFTGNFFAGPVALLNPKLW